MEAITVTQPVPVHLRGAAVALGNFDGVHRGHRAVIAVAQDQAASEGRPAGVITFHPHPRIHFAPGTPFFRLTPQATKLALFEEIGLDVAFVLPFDAALAALTPTEFIDEILVGRLGVAHVVAGWDYHFGAKRAGNAEVLSRLCHERGIGVTTVKAQSDGSGEVFSSSRIRAALAGGRPEEAERLLGYPWRVRETVVSGDSRGHGLGFPTINMRLDPGIELAHGIYAVHVDLGDAKHDGAAYFGTKPTFNGKEAFLEVFVFDFDGDLYGREVEVSLIGFLRGDQAFDSSEDLVAQMHRDCADARHVLDQHRASALVESI